MKALVARIGIKPGVKAQSMGAKVKGANVSRLTRRLLVALTAMLSPAVGASNAQ